MYAWRFSRGQFGRASRTKGSASSKTQRNHEHTMKRSLRDLLATNSWCVAICVLVWTPLCAFLGCAAEETSSKAPKETLQFLGAEYAKNVDGGLT